MNPQNYAMGGTTYVLKIDGYQGDAASNWNHASNGGEPRILI